MAAEAVLAHTCTQCIQPFALLHGPTANRHNSTCLYRRLPRQACRAQHHSPLTVPRINAMLAGRTAPTSSLSPPPGTYHLAPRGPRLHTESQGAQPPAQPPAAAAPAPCPRTPAASPRQQPPQHLLHPPAPHRPRLVRPPRQIHPLQGSRPCSHTTPRRLPRLPTSPARCPFIRRLTCIPRTRPCSPGTLPRLRPPAAALLVPLVQLGACPRQAQLQQAPTAGHGPQQAASREAGVG